MANHATESSDGGAKSPADGDDVTFRQSRKCSQSFYGQLGVNHRISGTQHPEIRLRSKQHARFRPVVPQGWSEVGRCAKVRLLFRTLNATMHDKYVKFVLPKHPREYSHDETEEAKRALASVSHCSASGTSASSSRGTTQTILNVRWDGQPMLEKFRYPQDHGGSIQKLDFHLWATIVEERKHPNESTIQD